MTAKDILVIVIIPLALAELGPWCGWLAAKLIPKAAKLRYGDTERAVVRAEEWSGDLDKTPGQLSKLGYAGGLFLTGSAIFTTRKARNIVPGNSARRNPVPVKPALTVDDGQTRLMVFQTHQETLNTLQDTLTRLMGENEDQAQGAAAHKVASSFISDITD
jgi:hypothetical protein